MNLQTKLLSVIIPVYNVRQYLKKCLDSVINQTYTNLEIIVIDDGSNDGSGDLCDAFLQKDDRIRVVHQSNQGLAVARNVGLDMANGEWIAFVDSDDWLDENMYEILINLANKYDADIASCSVNECVYGSREKIQDITEDHVSIYTCSEIIKGLLSQENVRFEVWNKVWKRRLISDVRFVPRQVSEDIHFDRILYMRTNKMVYTDRPLYNYLIMRPGSTATSFKKERIKIFKEFDQWINELEAMNDIVSKEIIQCIATTFVIALYEEACKTGQDRLTRNMIQAEYNKYYNPSRGSTYRTKKEKIMAKLFNVNPKLYITIKNIKDMAGIHFKKR